MSNVIVPFCSPCSRASGIVCPFVVVPFVVPLWKKLSLSPDLLQEASQRLTAPLDREGPGAKPPCPEDARDGLAHCITILVLDY